MRVAYAWLSVALAATVGWAGPSHAADHKNVFPEAARAMTGVRAVEVRTPQAELSSNINPSIATLALGGGVLGVVIDAKVDNTRAKRAQSGITPVREALADFDGDQHAIDATDTVLKAAPWLGTTDPKTFGRDTSLWGRNAALDAHAGKAEQVVFLDYTYDTAPDFSAIRVGVTITVANTALPANGKPEARLIPVRNLAYSQTVTSIVLLDAPGDAAANATRWAANGGALARRALDQGFQSAGALVVRALGVKEADLAALSSGEKRSLAGVSGKVVEEGSDGVLLFNGGFAQVRTIHD